MSRDAHVIPATRRHLLVAAVCVALAGLLTLTLDATSNHSLIALPALLVPFWLSDRYTLVLEVRGDALAFGLSSATFIVGLAYLPPHALIACRLAVAVVVLAELRLPRSKTVLNLSIEWLESALALYLVDLLGLTAIHPATWLLALLVTAAKVQAGATSISVAYHLELRQAVRSQFIALAMTVVDTSLGLLVLTILQHEPWGLAPLGVISVLVFSAYKAHEKLSGKLRELDLIHGFSASLAGAVVDGRVAANLLEQACEVLNADKALLVIPAEAGLRVITSTEPDAPRPPSGEELIAHRACTAAPNETRRLDADALGAREALGAAFPVEADRFATLLVLDRSGDLRGFDEEDERRLATLASQAGVAVQNGELVEDLRHDKNVIEHLSLHDALTGLPNRRNLVLQLDAALARRATVAVLTVDLNDFRAVNDALGYDRGDDLIRVLGRRLVDAVGEQHLVAHFGGDSFVVLLDSVDPAEAAAIAHTIRDVVAEPVTIGDLPVRMSASIGIALAPEHASESTSLIRMSDVAMHVAKNEESGIELYDQARHDAAADRLQLMADLRRSIEDGALEVWFQPQIDLRTNAAVGAEALVRWHHPERGFVPPDRFIPMAEQTGLIHPLTELVIAKSLASAREFARRGHELIVSINVSARDLAEPGFADTLRRLVGESGVRPDTLIVELTETAVIHDRMRSIAVLQEIRSMGIGLAIDDFGQGQSSMVYLAQLPLTSIKIDRSFITRKTAAREAIVRAVVQLGRSFDCKIVAEGIEDDETAQDLARLECGYGQGYLYSRPVPEAAFATWLDEWQATHAIRV